MALLGPPARAPRGACPVVVAAGLGLAVAFVGLAVVGLAVSAVWEERYWRRKIEELEEEYEARAAAGLGPPDPREDEP